MASEKTSTYIFRDGTLHRSTIDYWSDEASFDEALTRHGFHRRPSCRFGLIGEPLELQS
jgi:hypothetical protein